jgi:hypothetical protein
MRRPSSWYVWTIFPTHCVSHSDTSVLRSLSLPRHTTRRIRYEGHGLVKVRQIREAAELRRA